MQINESSITAYMCVAFFNSIAKRFPVGKNFKYVYEVYDVEIRQILCSLEKKISKYSFR